MKRILITLTAALLAVFTVGCATVTATPKTAKYEKPLEFYYVKDWAEPKEPSGMVRIKQEIDEREAERIASEAAEAESEAASDEEWYEEYQEWDTYAYSGSDSADGFKSKGERGGVDSDTETWYSSRVAYHKDTPNWHTDDEGYYHDPDGYYVVSSNDYEYGTVVQTSKGEGRVLDEGTGSGNFDMYVDW